MNYRQQESLLKHVMAFAFFVLALGLLPVTNQILIEHQGELQNPEGEVAGVSTERILTNQATPCNEGQLADLQAAYDLEKSTILTRYESLTREYNQAKQQLSGAADLVAQESQSLDDLLNVAQITYYQDLSAAERDFESQKAILLSDSCPLE